MINEMVIVSRYSYDKHTADHPNPEHQTLHLAGEKERNRDYGMKSFLIT